MNAQTGVVSLARSLDYDTTSSYSVLIIAQVKNIANNYDNNLNLHVNIILFTFISHVHLYTHAHKINVMKLICLL